jgi:hypothetical protein
MVVQSLAGCAAGIVEDSRQYAVDLDHEITAWYKEALGAVAERVRQGASAEGLAEVRSEFRAIAREHKARGERYVGGLRQRLRENAEALSAMAQTLTADHADHDAMLRTELGKLRSAADSPDVATLRASVREVASALDECIRLMKTRNMVAIAELTSEIRVLHSQLDGMRRTAAVSVRDVVASEMAAGNAFMLVFVHLQNLPIVARRHGSIAAAQVAEACLTRLKAVVPENGSAGCWDEGLLAVVVNGTVAKPVEFMRNVGARIAGPYVVAAQDRSARIELMVGTAGFQRLPADPPEKTNSRIQDLLLSMGLLNRA